MSDPMHDVDLRSASLMDADDVAVLLSALGYPCEREDASDRIHAIIANDRQALVLARHDGAVCGLIALDFMYYLPLGTTTCRITAMVVTPEAQGRGLGEALIRRLLDDRTEKQVLLSTPEINGEANRAWRLYRRLGFTDVIRGYHFAGDPRPFAILGRSLPL